MAKVRIILGVLILLVVTLAAPSREAAAQGGTLRCSFTTTASGYDVTWDSQVDNADRFVIERYATRRYWWRGSSDSENGTFQDGPAPRGSASMAYRVVAKDSAGKALKTADCSNGGSPGFHCSAALQTDGTYVINWNTRAGGNDTDYVVRRQVRPRSTFYWRMLATGNRATDSASPTGEATYRVLARSSGVITANSLCSTGIAPPPTPNTSCAVDAKTVATALDQIECDALSALNSNGVVGDPTIDPCDWAGVECTSGHVVSIQLNAVDLNSTIPPALGDLSELRTLELIDVGLHGIIPADLAQATNLRSLNLRSNSLQGSIPVELTTLRHLFSLAMEHNQLTGVIPPELGAMPRLGVIALGNNQLTGEIPPELGNLTLDGLGLDFNNLSGKIPPELGKLIYVQGVALQGNQLTGEIPAELGNMERVQSIGLTNNRLTGPIPAELGDLRHLRHLYLGGNDLTGEIPAELGQLSNLLSLFVYNNDLTGTLPPELSGLDSLQRLLVFNNRLTGDITAAMSGVLDTVKLASLRVPTGHNCFTVSDDAIATQLTFLDSDWDTCLATG